MIQVGRVLGPHGVHGAIKVESLTDFEDRFAPGAAVYVGDCRFAVVGARPAPGQRGRPLIVELAELDSRAAAAALGGSFLEVPDAEGRPPAAGSWYHHQLVGLEVVTEQGRALGTVTEVWQRPANDVWVAELRGVQHLIPAICGAVLEVDPQAGRVVVAAWVCEVEDA